MKYYIPKYLIWAVLGENTTILPYTKLFQPHVWWWCLSRLGGNNTVAWWSLWAGWVEVGCADVTIPVYIHCGIPQAIVVRLWCHAWRRIKPFHWPMYYNFHEYQWADCIGAIKRFHCKPHIPVNFTGRCYKNCARLSMQSDGQKNSKMIFKKDTVSIQTISVFSMPAQFRKYIWHLIPSNFAPPQCNMLAQFFTHSTCDLAIVIIPAV